MEFYRANTLLHKLCIVDGVGKCGKSIMLDFLGSFPGMEKQDFVSCLEYISLAYKYNKISKDIAMAILQTEIDTELYNNMIGRYVNMRLSDDTSVYKYHSPEKYLQRSLEPGGPIVTEKVLKEKPIYLSWAHDLINKSDLIFETFQHKLEWIYINRRPIDIIFEWNKQGYSQRMSVDPTEMQYNIKYKNFVVPELALGWEEEFLNSSPLERTIKLIYTSFKLNHESLSKNKTNQNLHIFNFDDLVTKPHQEIERLKIIFQSEPSNQIYNALRKTQCPRVIDELEFVRRKEEITSNLSSPYKHLLSELNNIYEEIKQMAYVKNIAYCEIEI